VTYSRRRAAVTLTTTAIAVAALTSCAIAGIGAPVTDPHRPATPRLTATAYVHEAEQLIADIAHTIAPTATVSVYETDTGPTPCSAPFEGDVWWTITRLVHIPKGQGVNGKDLIPAVAAQLEQRGYWVDNDGPHGAFTRLRAGTTLVGMSVLGYTDAPTIQFNIDTECGTP
jgi:hypothetical protein